MGCVSDKLSFIEGDVACYFSEDRVLSCIVVVRKGGDWWRCRG